MSVLDQQEQEALHLINEGKTDEATKLLYDLIVAHAKAKNFDKAENLRERLIACNSMALTEIINSAEIIEAEKSESIDSGHREIWASLYSKLSQEEANAFFHKLQEVTILADKTIAQQGKPNARLFFVNQGELKVSFQQGQEEFLITKLGKGDIAGGDSFFPISLCTNSITTLSSCKLSYLERKDLESLSEKLPDLEGKLEAHYMQMQQVKDILKNENMDRRLYVRHKCAGKIMTQIVNAKGEHIGNPFRGQIDDLSEGGVAYLIKSSKKETARLLLGRRTKINIYKTDEEDPSFTAEATIVAVQSLLYNDYSIHLKFDSPLDNEAVKNFASRSK